jgi:hypothetical protein
LSVIRIGSFSSGRGESLRSVTAAAAPSLPCTSVALSTFTYALGRVTDGA